MAKKSVNSEIMKSIQQYIEKISKYYKIYYLAHIQKVLKTKIVIKI